MTFSPEEKMLCRLLAGSEKPTLPGNDDEWESLFSAARIHGVNPVLAWQLQAMAQSSNTIPETVQSRVQAVLRRGAANSLQVDRTLASLISGLEGAGLQALFLKGAFFRSLYPNVALRTLDDIDLLAARPDLDAASQVIEGLGYQRMRPLRHNDDLWLATDHHYVFHAKGAERLAIELHWNLAGNDGEWRTPPLAWFWEEAVPLQANSAVVRTLSPTAHLLHQAAHQYLQHPERIRLKWLFDLHLLLMQCGETIEWDTAIRKAKDFNWSHALALALGTIHECFQTPLPYGVLPQLAQDADPRSIAMIGLATKTDSTTSERALDFLGRLPASARRRHLFGILFPSRKYLVWRYNPRPAWIFFIYYPYRWLIMASDLIKTLLKRAGLPTKK